MKKIIALVALSVLLAGCVRSGANKVSVNEAQLTGHRFVLETVNGQAFAAGDQPAELRFDAKMKVSGSVCNDFSGQGKVSEGTLKVKDIAMTRKMCADEQRNALDNTLTKLLTAGTQVDLTDSQLTLTTVDQTLIYKMADQVQ